jgi:hypothetical protein
MVPGDSRSGSLSISNSGNVAGNVSLRLGELSNSPAGTDLSATLELTVQEVSGEKTTQLWSGKLGALGSVALGFFGSGQSREFRFILTWPSSAQDASLQGATSSFAFEWVGVS